MIKNEAHFFLIDVSHTGVEVPPSLPSKEPKLVMFYTLTKPIIF